MTERHAMQPATAAGEVRHPWRLPLTLLGVSALAAIPFTRAYGPLDSVEWALAAAVSLAFLFWGFIRSLQHGPAFQRRTPASAYSPEPLGSRIASSLRASYSVAAGFSAYALLISLLQGRHPNGMSLGRILAVYIVAALVGGLALGALKPLTRFRAGAFAVGTTVGILVYGAAMLATSTRNPAPWWLPIVPGTIVGGGLGLVFYDEQ